MSTFKEMDPDIALKLIEGYDDVLTPEGMKLEKFYQHFKCPRGCGDLQKEFDTRHAFSDPDTLTPRALLRCPNCRYLIDPFSGVVVESGSPAKMPVEIIPDLGSKEH